MSGDGARCSFRGRTDKNNDQSSCWIRVVQGWAGATWGAMAIPRVGQELIISYLDGDPDQPIAIGWAYRQTNLPPYELPKHKTRMTIKSRTHKGKGFNELRFEDELGQQEVFIHAEKDKNVHIKNDNGIFRRQRPQGAGRAQRNRVHRRPPHRGRWPERNHQHRRQPQRDHHISIGNRASFRIRYADAPY